MLAEFDWGQAILGSPIFISLIVFWLFANAVIIDLRKAN